MAIFWKVEIYAPRRARGRRWLPLFKGLEAQARAAFGHVVRNGRRALLWAPDGTLADWPGKGASNGNGN